MYQGIKCWQWSEDSAREGSTWLPMVLELCLLVLNLGSRPPLSSRRGGGLGAGAVTSPGAV